MVSRSLTEAKYRAMAMATCEVIWIKSLLKDLGFDHKKPIDLFCDICLQYIF